MAHRRAGKSKTQSGALYQRYQSLVQVLAPVKSPHGGPLHNLMRFSRLLVPLVHFRKGLAFKGG